MRNEYADIIIPLSVAGTFTYRVPPTLSGRVMRGCRVVVPFGARKTYTGIVYAVHTVAPEGFIPRDISDVLAKSVVLNEKFLDLIIWMSDYYLSTPGEVIKAAIPSPIIPEGRMQLVLTGITNNETDRAEEWLTDILGKKGQVFIDSLPSKFEGRSIMDIVGALIEKGVITNSGEVHEYEPSKEELLIAVSPECWEELLIKRGDVFARAPRQRDLAEAYLRLLSTSGHDTPVAVKRTTLLKESGASAAVLNNLVSKGFFSQSVMTAGNQLQADDVIPPVSLNKEQDEACRRIRGLFTAQEVVLLHGVTSSGKTEIYIHLIKEQLDRGKQVLYMLPEIALTTQIIERLQRHFGRSISIYHSRMSTSSRLEVWKKVSRAQDDGRINLILGVRSSLFLPFSDLGLVIIDEEHDSSYKQYEPAPRYHARDTAIMLSRLHGAKTLLGSATPAIESYYNAKEGKYGLVELMSRYGEVLMPEMILADTRKGNRKSGLSPHFTLKLLGALENALANGEQAILFQNRRGFSPYVICSECGWVPGCRNCSVSYTYHKSIDRMVCHYCGRSERPVKACPECGSTGLITKGFGTEKIEEEIRILFPSSMVARMDQDTTRKRGSHAVILSDFGGGSTDILIGTQMISKGLDFENLTLVGILDADSMLHFPDFRAFERSFQLMEQVSGRAGRRTRQGKVVIQTSDPGHSILRQVLKHDYMSMYQEQVEERRIFSYPPFTRLIRIILKHHQKEQLNIAATRLADNLRKDLGGNVLGPEFPLVMQVQKWYIKTILVKIGRNLSLTKVKEKIRRAMEAESRLPGQSGIRIFADVDPQ